MTDPYDWHRAEVFAARVSHVLCECPNCLTPQLRPYCPPSTPWPRCRVCRPESGKPARVVPVAELEHRVGWREVRARRTPAKFARVVGADAGSGR